LFRLHPSDPVVEANVEDDAGEAADESSAGHSISVHMNRTQQEVAPHALLCFVDGAVFVLLVGSATDRTRQLLYTSDSVRHRLRVEAHL
jgi:hypothetical protein